MNNGSTYKSSMDRFTTQTTNGITIAVIVAVYLMWRYYESSNNLLVLGTAGLVVLVYALAYLAVGRSYTVSPDELVINCYLLPVHIPKDELTAIRIVAREERTLMRVYAFGGVFGYTGLYFSQQLGNIFVYARKLSGDMVAVERNERKIYLLAPDDVEGFVNALAERA